MKQSTLALIMLLLIESLLIGGAAFAIIQINSGHWQAGTNPAEVVRRIGQVAGVAAPLIAMPFVLIFITARRKGR